VTVVYVVIIPNGMILAAYIHESHADVHARTITGSRVLTLQIHDALIDSVTDDIASEHWDDNGNTPVQEPESDITKTNPSTPRSKARSKPPTRT
jgi:hypothetical protein